MYPIGGTRALRLALAAIPVTLLILLISPVWLIAIALPRDRRIYALKLIDAATELVRAITS